MKTSFIHIFFYLTVCFCVTACGGQDGNDRSLDCADALIDVSPDSALTVLESLTTERMTEGQRARHALLATKAATKSYMPLESDSLIRMAVDYYAGRGDSLETQSLYYLGYTYSINGVSDSALVCLSRAYEVAVPEHDYFYSAISAREMAAVYRRLFMIDEALKWAETAKQQFVKADKPLHAAWMDDIIADALIFSGDFNSAKDLLDSMTYSEYYQNESFRRHVLINQVELALQKQSFGEIDSLYDALADERYDFTAHDYLNLAEAALLSGRLKDAGTYLSQAEQLDMSDADSLFWGKISSNLCAADRDYKTAYELSEKFSENLMNSDVRLLSHPQTMLLTENYKLKAENHRLQIERSQEFIIGLVSICVLLVALIVLLYKYFKSRLVKEKLEAMNSLHEVRSLRHELQSLSGNLHNDLSQLFSRHVELLDGVCNAYYKRHEFDKVIDKVQSIEVADGLMSVIDSRDNHWMTRFKDKYPGLKPESYLLVMYLYLGFSTEAISVLTRKTKINALYVDKSRLKKKMLEINGGVVDDFMTRIGMG